MEVISGILGEFNYNTWCFKEPMYTMKMIATGDLFAEVIQMWIEADR